MREEQTLAMRELIRHRKRLTRHEFKTLKGLIFEGRPEAALKGLDTCLKQRRERKR